MEKIKSSEYILPLTLSQVCQFVEKEKFVKLQHYYDYDAAYDREYYNSGHTIYHKEPNKKGYFLCKPFVIEEFDVLTKYFKMKKDTKKEKFIVEIFNKYIGIKYVENPTIIYRKQGSGKGYYRNPFDFYYGEPKVENFCVYEILDHRPEAIKDLMYDFVKIARLETEKQTLTKQEKQKEKEISEKMDLVNTKYENIMTQSEKEL